MSGRVSVDRLTSSGEQVEDGAARLTVPDVIQRQLCNNLRDLVEQPRPLVRPTSHSLLADREKGSQQKPARDSRCSLACPSTLPAFAGSDATVSAFPTVSRGCLESGAGGGVDVVSSLASGLSAEGAGESGGIVGTLQRVQPARLSGDSSCMWDKVSSSSLDQDNSVDKRMCVC